MIISIMLKLIHRAVNLQIWKDRKGQDLIDDALMAGFVAVFAGVVIPGVTSSINSILSQVNSVLVAASSM